MGRGGEDHLDGVPKDEVSHHGISSKNNPANQAEVQQIRSCQCQGPRHNPQPRLKVHQLQDAQNEQQDVQPVQCVVPRQRVHQVLRANPHSSKSQVWKPLFQSKGPSPVSRDTSSTIRRPTLSDCHGIVSSMQTTGVFTDWPITSPLTSVQLAEVHRSTFSTRQHRNQQTLQPGKRVARHTCKPLAEQRASHFKSGETRTTHCNLANREEIPPSRNVAKPEKSPPVTWQKQLLPPEGVRRHLQGSANWQGREDCGTLRTAAVR
jgi:hypothetical protein